ncbi:MAG: hypothetical protein NC311_07625 [Muribaculaceae bacterium]|nr:hypothetical protein [Muribaculaceae bacterium]
MKPDLLTLRYPHSCRIVRLVESTDPFSDKEDEVEVIYEGKCRRESLTNIRTFRTGSSQFGQVQYGDYRLSLPGRVEVKKGDTIEFVDFVIGEDRDVMVLHPNYSPLPMPGSPDGSTECYYNLSDI